MKKWKSQMIVRVKCAECGKIYNRNINTGISQTTIITTSINACPDCGSDYYIRADTIWEKG